MTTKKFFKYTLIGTLPTALILSATLTPPIFLNNQSIQNSQNTTVLNSSTLADEQIDFSNVIKTNWTWPNDVYASTGGYKYVSMQDSNDTIFTLNKNGFTVNPSHPPFSLITHNFVYDGIQSSVHYRTGALANLSIDSQSYNIASNTWENLISLANMDIHFGFLPSQSTLISLSNLNLDYDTPYFKVGIPIADFKVERRGGTDPKLFDGIAGENMLKNNIVNENYTGNKTTNVIFTDPTRHTPFSGSPYYNLAVTVPHVVNISIFNDYDSAGNFVKTHMLNHGMNFNSILPTLTINEAKLNKNFSVSKQNTNVSDIVTLSNAESIPSLADGNVTAIKDIAAGTITFNYKPVFIFNNGMLEKYIGPGVNSKVISGFSLFNTFISSKIGYSDAILVDRFINSIRKDGDINVDELGKYLDLSSVPLDAIYNIPDNSIDINLVKGIIKFLINASNGYDSDDVLTNATTPNFPITLQLTPRITKYTNAINSENWLVIEYYDKVFDVNGKIKLNEFNKYTSIIAPVDNAEYFLVPNTWTHHTGDGTLSFQFYASKYYDANGLEKTGSSSDDSTHQTIILTLNPLPSSVAVKVAHTPTHRVDNFMDLLADTSTGVIKDLNLLKQYVDLENIPSTANISIDPSSIKMDDYDPEQYYTENVHFDLVIDKFNETSTNVVAETIPLTIKLSKAHLETKISVKTLGDYNGNVVVDRLLPQIINKEKVVVNRAKLEEYVNIEALAINTEIKVDNIVSVDDTGVLTFDLIPAVVYDANSNPTYNKVYQITLQLVVRPLQTVIEANDNLVDPEQVDIFANKILKFTNFKDLMNYLTNDPNEPQYVTLASGFSVPDDQIQFKIKNLKYKDIGDLSFDLVVSNTYADGGEVEGFATFPINLKLGQKHAPTKLTLIPQYPNGASVTEFIDTVTQAASDQDALKTFLSNFIQGINTIPTTAIINLDILEANETTGMINFILAATTYYDNQSNVINDYRSPTFSLKLVSKDQQDTRTTSVNWKNDVSFTGDAIDFFDQINRNGILNYTQLYKYIIIEHLPVQATISIVNKDAEFDNPMLIQFDVVLTHWYDQGTLKPETTDPEQAKHTPLEKNLFVIGAVSKNSDFQWWWIVLAISGVVLILTTFFIVKHYKQNKKF